MAIGDSKRVLVLEADERDVLRAQAAIDRAEAATAKKRDQALVAHLKGQGAVTKETLATARAAQALIDKEKEAAKAADLIGFSVDTSAKKMGGLTRGAVEFDRKLGDIGKTLGGMAVGFGIQAGLSIVGELLKPPTREDMDAFIAGLQDASGALGIAANHARMLRGHLDAQAKQDAALDKKFSAVDDVIAQYSGASREAKMLEELRIVDLAYQRTLNGKPGLTAEQHSRAVSEIAAKYKAAAGGAERIAVAVERAGRAPAPKVLGFGALPGNIPYADLDRDIAESDRKDAARRADEQRVANEAFYGSADFHARAAGARGMSNVQLAGKGKAQGLGDYLSELNLASKAHDAFASSALSAYNNVIEGHMGLGKAAKATAGGTVKGLGNVFFTEFLGESAYAVKALAFRDFAGAAKHGKAAGMFLAGATAAGSIAASMGGGGGGYSGGGGGGGSLTSGDRYGGPQDLRGGAGGEQVHHHIYSSGGFTQRELLQHSRRMRALTTDTNAEG